MVPARSPHRALLVGALGHTAVATCLTLVRYSQPRAFDDAAGLAVLLPLRFGLEGLFNPHIPIADLLTVLLLGLGSVAFLAGDYVSGLVAFRLLAGGPRT